MEIVIGMVVLALIYFLYRKLSAGSSPANEDDAAAGTPPQAEANPPPAVSSHRGPATAVLPAQENAASTPPPVAPAVTSECAELPLEHLVSINSKTAATLRALGISDLQSLADANAETLMAAGFEGTAARNVKAQALLSALPGVSPHELSALAASGVSSIASLAKEEAEKLAVRVDKSNRRIGSLKTGLGIQQLRRIIGAANAAS